MRLTIFFLLIFSITSCNTILENTVPMPKIVEHEHKPKFFGNDEYHLTIHNSGSDGNVFIKITRGSDIYTKTLFFSKEERRKVVIKMTGNSNAKNIQVEVIAEDLRDI